MNHINETFDDGTTQHSSSQGQAGAKLQLQVLTRIGHDKKANNH